MEKKDDDAVAGYLKKLLLFPLLLNYVSATAVSNKNKMEQLFSLGAFELLKRSFILISNQADILSANYPVRTEGGKKRFVAHRNVGVNRK